VKTDAAVYDRRSIVENLESPVSPNARAAAYWPVCLFSNIAFDIDASVVLFDQLHLDRIGGEVETGHYQIYISDHST